MMQKGLAYLKEELMDLTSLDSKEIDFYLNLELERGTIQKREYRGNIFWSLKT